MGDNLQIKGPADANRVNIHEPWEVSYWCKTLGCSEWKLKQAVAAVGVMVKDVRDWLRTH
jgi:hypothetical protein